MHKAPKFETETISIPQELRSELSHPKFKTSKDVASVNYKEPVRTDRPKNVYIEMINGSYWLWYITERSTEVGILRNFVTDERTQIKTEYGYDCNIPATIENINMLREMTYAGTQYIFKDGVRRTVIDIDEFTKKL